MSRGRQVFVVTALSLAVAAAPSLSQAEEAADEQLVKAEFVERFTRFIDWPQSTLPPRSEFDLCVIGKTAVGARLEQLSQARKFKRRTCSFRQVRRPSRLQSCNLVFIASSESGRLEDILRYTHGRPILTIGDTRGYARRGVIINLYPASKALRFEINIASALESGLRIRSKLLKLARLVGGRGGVRP